MKTIYLLVIAILLISCGRDESDPTSPAVPDIELSVTRFITMTQLYCPDPPIGVTAYVEYDIENDNDIAADRVRVIIDWEDGQSDTVFAGEDFPPTANCNDYSPGPCVPANTTNRYRSWTHQIAVYAADVRVYDCVPLDKEDCY